MLQHIIQKYEDLGIISRHLQTAFTIHIFIIKSFYETIHLNVYCRRGSITRFFNNVNRFLLVQDEVFLLSLMDCYPNS